MKMVKEIFLEWESEKIFSMPLRYAQNEDSQFQSLSRDGRYYVKSGYKIAMKSKPDVVASSSRILGDWWKKLWKIRTQPRCSQFVCKVCPDIIPIRQNLMRRGMMLDPNCPRCGEKVEYATHALLTCGKVRIWWLFSYRFARTLMEKSIAVKMSPTLAPAATSKQSAMVAFWSPDFFFGSISCRIGS